MWIRALFFIFITIVILLSIVNSRRKEYFDDNKLHFEGSVHLSGNIATNNIPNKIRVKSLCFRKNEGGEIKEECLDSGQFSFALNNTTERNYFKCLGETCIDNKHLDIIKNKNNFKIRNVKKDRCYTMRDVMLHGLGGNYAEIHRPGHLNSMQEQGLNGIKKLRGYWRGSGGGLYYEHWPGKQHDDDGDGLRWLAYTDGGYRNRPWIPNFVVGENCDLENDGLFKKYLQTQDKNQFRFIKTTNEGEDAEITAASLTPQPEASSEFSGEMPGTGMQVA